MPRVTATVQAQVVVAVNTRTWLLIRIVSRVSKNTRHHLNQEAAYTHQR